MGHPRFERLGIAVGVDRVGVVRIGRDCRLGAARLGLVAALVGAAGAKGEDREQGRARVSMLHQGLSDRVRR